MKRKKDRARKLPAITWAFPLLVVLALTVTASRRSQEVQIKKLLQEYGYTEAELLQLGQKDRERLLQLAASDQREHDHPWSPRLSVVDTGADLIFPHFGDGQIPGTDRNFQTTWTLSNFTGHDTAGTLEIYDSSGQPQEVTINDVTASRFDFEILSRQVIYLVTSGSGPVKTGWVHVHSDQPLAASSSFGIRDSQGAIITDVGVAAAETGTEYTLFADTLADSNTGLAVANPSDVDTLTLDFELREPDGDLVATRSRELGPRGHLSLFLTELYSDVPGIEEFEGTVVIRAQGEASATGPAPQAHSTAGGFAGITLRATGDVLTSLPLVPPPAADSQRRKLAFPHVGDGVAAGLSISTSTILFNNTAEVAGGVLEFLNSDATPMEVTIDGNTDSMFEFSLQPFGALRLETSGEGDLKVGWARVNMDQPLAGTAMFSIFDAGSGLTSFASPLAAGALITEVGVPAAAIYQDVRLMVDTMGPFDTGFALVFPLEEAGESMRADLTLWDNAGGFKGRKQLTLGQNEHTSIFVTQQFQDVPGIQEFQGYLNISARSSFFGDPYFAPLALRSAGVKLTSTPNLVFGNGFAPVSTLEFAQTLAGTSPALEWRLHQNSQDWSIESVKITAPELGVNTEAFQPGDILAQGYLPDGSFTEIFDFVVTEKGSLRFDAVLAQEDGGVRHASGSLDGTPEGGLTFELTGLNLRQYTVNARTTDTVYLLPADLINFPDSPGPITVMTEFVSVSTRPDRDERIRRRTMQEVILSGHDPSLANLEAIRPRFPVSGEALTLIGTNLGDSPTVLFPTLDGDTAETQALRIDDENLVVFVPHGAVSGTLAVDNGTGPGNPYNVKIRFSPLLESGWFSEAENGPAENGAGEGVFLRFRQRGEQFFMERFEAVLAGTDIDFADLEVGQEVGRGDTQGGPLGTLSFQLFVESLEEARAILTVSSFGETFAQIVLERTTVNEETALRMTYFPVEARDIPIIFNPFDFPFLPRGVYLEFIFDGLPLQLPASGELVLVGARTFSTPTLPVADPAAEEIDFLRLETAPFSVWVVP